MIRIDGAGASRELVKHLLTLSSPRRTVLFACGWMITASDEVAIAAVPDGARKPGARQDGSPEDDKDIAGQHPTPPARTETDKKPKDRLNYEAEGESGKPD